MITPSGCDRIAAPDLDWAHPRNSSWFLKMRARRWSNFARVKADCRCIGHYNSYRARSAKSVGSRHYRLPRRESVMERTQLALSATARRQWFEEARVSGALPQRCPDQAASKNHGAANHRPSCMHKTVILSAVFSKCHFSNQERCPFRLLVACGL